MEFARRHDLWLVSDECYEAITFGAPHVSPGAFDTEGRVLGAFSFSKTYAMTGMRVGYLVVPPALAAVCAKLQEPLVACVNAPAQYGALAALTGPQDQVAAARDAYLERRDAAATNPRQGWPALPPARGGLLPLGGRLLPHRRRRVGLGHPPPPGAARRGGPRHHLRAAGEGWVRLSLATATDDLLEGLTRLLDFR